jgi:hypothetical protein
MRVRVIKKIDQARPHPLLVAIRKKLFPKAKNKRDRLAYDIEDDEPRVLIDNLTSKKK